MLSALSLRGEMAAKRGNYSVAVAGKDVRPDWCCLQETLGRWKSVAGISAQILNGGQHCNCRFNGARRESIEAVGGLNPSGNLIGHKYHSAHTKYVQPLQGGGGHGSRACVSATPRSWRYNANSNPSNHPIFYLNYRAY